ncbi:hypothetical protein RhiirA4_456572 [Rhizophagus irregularis]|uniref:Uncharacterized protein n=1 Tax=Rhizophagus irregularis TaxID=588596 RepID=A0A2I1G7U6_9GLOM|nr:hypothetical protein RhiirA4_456572 [Rhizophagus irregularis]
MSQLVTEDNRLKIWSQVTKLANRSSKGVVERGWENFEKMFNEEAKELIIMDKRMEIIGKICNDEKYHCGNLVKNDKGKEVH